MRRPVPQTHSPLPDSDHVLRYIPPRHVEDGVVNGEAFLAKPAEDAPSVNWLEWFDPPIENQVAGVRSLARVRYAKTGRLAQLNVGQTIQYVRENDPNGLVLSFVHDPSDATDTHPADPSRSLIYSAPTQDTPEATLIKDLMADCILPPLFPAAPTAVPAEP
jgi:hypothetical protein